MSLEHASRARFYSFVESIQMQQSAFELLWRRKCAFAKRASFACIKCTVYVSGRRRSFPAFLFATKRIFSTNRRTSTFLCVYRYYSLPKQEHELQLKIYTSKSWETHFLHTVRGKSRTSHVLAEAVLFPGVHGP